MKVDPDELLKTKGKLKSKIIDPDGCLKTNELYENGREAGMLLKGMVDIARLATGPENRAAKSCISRRFPDKAKPFKG